MRPMARKGWLERLWQERAAVRKRMRKRRSKGRRRDGGGGGSSGGEIWGLWSGWMSARMNGEKCSWEFMRQRKVGGGPGERGGGVMGVPPPLGHIKEEPRGLWSSGLGKGRLSTFPLSQYHRRGEV